MWGNADHPIDSGCRGPAILLGMERALAHVEGVAAKAARLTETRREHVAAAS